MIGDAFDGLIVIWIAAAIYLAPSIVAFARNVSSPWSIVVINVLLGWTLIGWVVALALAVRTVKPSSGAAVSASPPQPSGDTPAPSAPRRS